MFKLRGVLLALYVASAAMPGEVVTKSGLGMRKVRRMASTRYFWTVMAIYAVLPLAMISWF